MTPYSSITALKRYNFHPLELLYFLYFHIYIAIIEQRSGPEACCTHGEGLQHDQPCPAAPLQLHTQQKLKLNLSRSALPSPSSSGILL